ncbi:MAG: HAD-IB family hydrolase [Betaproteobacteria bacterium]|nr:HAD-IB family hydrolase [Betaproteobacteria bacterium]
MFDLDHTLLPLDSDYSWGRFTAGLGWVDRAAFDRQNEKFFRDYRAGTLDIDAYVAFATAAFLAQGQAAAEAAHARYVQDIIAPEIRPQAVELVQDHKKQGATTIVITATNEFVASPVARLFGPDLVMAVELQRDATTGWFKGLVHGVPSFREGKVQRIESWLAQQGLAWSDVDSSFYSDSINDLPLLERVDDPVATNPDDTLRAIAQNRGWRILDLFGAAH